MTCQPEEMKHDNSCAGEFPARGDRRQPDLYSRVTDVSNLHEVSNLVLRDAVEELGGNSLCFGLSEKTFRDFIIMATIGYGRPNKWIVQYDQLGILIYWNMSNHDEFSVNIDEEQRCIRVKLRLNLAVVDKNWPLDKIPGDPNPSPYGIARVTFEGKVRPGNLTENTSFLQLRYEGGIVLELPPATVGYSSWEKIQMEWPQLKDVPQFREFMKEKIDAMISGNGDEKFRTILSKVVSVMPLPDYHQNVKGYKLTFQRFDYRKVVADSKNVGYLFLVFSVTSLKLPPSCNCPPTAGSNERSDFQHAVPPSDRWAAIGFSQEALQEISRPYIVGGSAFAFDTDGAIYGHVDGWWRYEVQEIVITSSGLESKVAVAEAGGVIRAGIRDCRSRDIVSASVSLEFIVNDSIIQWRVKVDKDPQDRNRTRVCLAAAAQIGSVEIKLQINPPPYPIDQILSWALSVISEPSLKSYLAKQIEAKGIYELFFEQRRAGNRVCWFEYVDSRYFVNQSLIIIGRPGID